MTEVTAPTVASERYAAVEGVVCLPGFWSERQRTVATVTARHALAELTRAGNVSYFEAAAAGDPTLLRVPRFKNEYMDSSLFDVQRIFDSDVYKWLEALAYMNPSELPSQVNAEADRIIELIVAAQRPDGYLHTWIQLRQPDAAWTLWHLSFELYCGGHLLLAGVAWSRRRHDDRLLQVAKRFADHVVNVVRDVPHLVPRHPGMEYALVALADELGDDTYLALAREFLDRRARPVPPTWAVTDEFYVEEVPVDAATTIRGHAVMALYLLSGAADVAERQRDAALWSSVVRQWNDLVATKIFVTGGVGARYYEEGFGDPYELPTDRSYAETCAAIASVGLAQRMLLMTGDRRYSDLIERTLYNAVLPGLSLGGDEFFYSNPLQVHQVTPRGPGPGRSGRQEWFECACCPPNVMRQVAAVADLVLTRGPSEIRVEQFISCSATALLEVGEVELKVATDLPFGSDPLRVDIVRSPAEPWTLSIRMPEWATVGEPQVSTEPTDSEVSGGYLRVHRRWRAGDSLEVSLTPTVGWFEAHPKVQALRGQVALHRGPVIYCWEEADQDATVDLDLAVVDSASRVEESELMVSNCLMPTLNVVGVAEQDTWSGTLYRSLRDAGPAPLGERVQLRAIPYFAWAHRGAGAMRVWIPRLGDTPTTTQEEPNAV